ncbi:unnamed protein product [Rhizophagus irregularis]|uniref:Uncharacterized protein n=1 Tax=Rhizophagus irregularis TaxID=588596 RepID=A0A2N1MBR0_9GLOM|nr:hypothetical protein RhiirC2_795344 [Rhizophagus irregularis]CAB4395499.1 unnamed protein product [Rhizophagus irregularis]CAB5369359.1 unnamed protein product [Rhizophagus irregularis]
MKFMSRRVVLYFFFLICVNHISYPRVESTEVKLTENSDNELSSNVMKALIMLEIASLSFRSAYIRADSSLWSFVNLRSSVTNEAKVYSIQILPITTTLIRHLQEFSETYDALSFDEFKEDVHKLEDQANIVLNDLQMETRRYEAELRPPPIIASEQKAIIAQEIAINEEKKLAVAKAKAIKETLVESINEFINAIGILEDQAKIHFILIKKKAATLVSACRFFMNRIPEFMAIPNNHDQNYVQKWLSKMKAEINGENLSFLEWGKKWFRSNKEIANLLGLPSNNDR